MKMTNALMTALSLMGLIGFADMAHAADGVVSKTAMAESSYCHMKFPPIDQSRSSAGHPVLESPNPGDLIDFYGPCDHDPLGKDEVQAQLQQQRRDFNE
jgi:hypothetical protein